jgi:hypothetical protein
MEACELIPLTPFEPSKTIYPLLLFRCFVPCAGEPGMHSPWNPPTPFFLPTGDRLEFDVRDLSAA